MFEAYVDSREDEEELFVQGHLQVYEPEWWIYILLELNPWKSAHLARKVFPQKISVVWINLFQKVEAYKVEVFQSSCAVVHKHNDHVKIVRNMFFTGGILRPDLVLHFSSLS